MKFLSLAEWLPSSKPRSPSSSSKGGVRRQPVSMPMLTLAFARRSFRVSKRIKKAAAAAGSGVSAAVTSHRFVSKRRALSPGERRPHTHTRASVLRHSVCSELIRLRCSNNGCCFFVLTVLESCLRCDPIFLWFSLSYGNTELEMFKSSDNVSGMLIASVRGYESVSRLLRA